MSLLDKAMQTIPMRGKRVALEYPGSFEEQVELAVAYFNGIIRPTQMIQALVLKKDGSATSRCMDFAVRLLREGVKAGIVSVSMLPSKSDET